MRTKASALLACVALALAAPAAAANNELAKDPTGTRPWAQGVSAENQQKALELFREGNALLRDSVFVQAAAKYREALRSWDHPAIHYNLVLALLNLDQPLELHENLVAAMKYGAEPLDSDKFEQAKTYKALVEKQLARVQVSCDVSGALVTLDGRTLFTAPGKYEGFVRAGPHSIVASKEGFLPNQVSKPLPAGEVTTVELQLFSADDLTQYKRRWSAWIPWTVLGAGAAVAATGGLLHYQAAQDFKSYDQSINTCGGCVPSADVASKRNQGTTFQSAAVVGYVVGGAALVTGAALVYANRPQPYHVGPDDKHVEVGVAPFVAPGTAGLVAVSRF